MEALSVGHFKLIKPGENQIKILVTNTEPNQRAVGTRHHILAAIDSSGMEGPVQVIPYLDRMLTLHATEGESRRQYAQKE